MTTTDPQRLATTSGGAAMTSDEKTETAEEYIERVRRQSMRDHPFVPARDPRYCGHWSEASRTGEYGILSFRSQCGYPPDTHPAD